MKQYVEITDVFAREILDSRATPTVEAEVITENGYIGRASVPSGASTGVYEAHELRDGDDTHFCGKGVITAVKNVNEIIAPKIVGMNVLDQKAIDSEMIKLDGTENKKKLGANAILSVSLACADAAAKELGIGLYQYIGGAYAHTLPVPMMNILNGGAHANNNIDIQEFMIMPVGAKNIKDAIQMCCSVYYKLKKLLSEKGFSTAVGDEGGFAPQLENDEQALIVICEAIKSAGYNTDTEFKIAIDAAASEWADGDGYTQPKSKLHFTKQQIINYWEDICKKYPVISLEDGVGENDWDAWDMLTKALGSKIQLVGDDLFVTNTERLKTGIERKCANSILIKVNQIGTLTETLSAIQTANRAGYTAVISHRSGETEDTTIADIAVAVNSGQIKTGAPCRSDRTSKYNQLIRIEEELGQSADYLGLGAFFNING